MNLRKLTQINYTAENIRQLLSYANGYEVTTMEVANLSRPGKALHACYVGRGIYDTKKTEAVIKAILLRRLAAELGRTSPRFLDYQDYKCPACQGTVAVWEGHYKCEHGHEGVFDGS